MKAVNVRETTALPIREISALAPGSDGSQLLAVGDEDFAVIAANVSDAGALGETRRHDLVLPLFEAGIDVRSGSGFEGVASDGEGTVLVLQEEISRLLVLSPDLLQLLQVLELEVPEDTPGYGTEWHEEPNARGEGILLLEGGHVLVAKQKDPVFLIEFGPSGHVARGVDSETVLAPGKPFQRPGGKAARLFPLAGWSLAGEAAEKLTSVNDLAFGGDEHVYLLSAKARLIARLETRLKPGEEADTAELWEIDERLAGDDDARPEGLALVGSTTPIVGFDTKVAGDNVMVLRQLSE